MNGKQFVIDKLEEALKEQKAIVWREIASIKSMKDEIAETEKEIAEAELQASGLKDALHKLKGLDNLEKKNIEHRRPDSIRKNLLRTETAMLYGRSIASYSLRELAAYIIHQSDRIKELLERE